jgi:hypothetical protein
MEPTTMKIPDHILCERLNDETVLLDLRSGLYFGLPPVASSLWYHLQNGESLDQARSAMLSEFDVDEQTLSHDIAGFVHALEEKGLLEDAHD